MLQTNEKIKLLLKRNNITAKAMAEKLNTVPSNITQKINRNNLTESDIRLYADILNCDVEITFIDRDTKERI